MLFFVFFVLGVFSPPPPHTHTAPVVREFSHFLTQQQQLVYLFYFCMFFLNTFGSFGAVVVVVVGDHDTKKPDGGCVVSVLLRLVGCPLARRGQQRGGDGVQRKVVVAGGGREGNALSDSNLEFGRSVGRWVVVVVVFYLYAPWKRG